MRYWRGLSRAAVILGVVLAAMGVPPVFAWGASGVEPIGQGWVNWEAAVLKARGFGVPPRDTYSPAQARLLARRAAIVDGYRMLTEISGVVLRRSETVLARYAIEVDTVVVAAEGVIRGAQVIQEREYDDGRYEVVLQVPLHGPGGLGSVLLPQVVPPAPGAPPQGAVPAPPAVPVQPAAPPSSTTPAYPGAPVYPGATPPAAYAAQGAFTGLVVVARGPGLQRSMTPRLITPRGEVVYGQWRPGEVDPDFAVRHGVAGFPKSVRESRRGGPRPLVIYAVGAAGPARTDILISEEDALRVRQANQGGRFLERFLVDIVLE